MFSKKLLFSITAASAAFTCISQGAVSLFIDDFQDEIGVSEESDMNFGAGNNWQALGVNAADPSDIAGSVPVTTLAGPSRTATATVTAVQPTSSVTGIYNTQIESLIGVLSIEVNDGPVSDSSSLSLGYEFTSGFDATAGGLLDTVEIKVESTDWDPTKGNFSVDFVDAGNGNVATWSFSPDTDNQVESALLNSLPPAPGAVDFSNLSEITFRLAGASDLDVTLSNFGLSGPPVPEPSSALLALLGSSFLAARRRCS